MVVRGGCWCRCGSGYGLLLFLLLLVGIAVVVVVVLLVIDDDDGGGGCSGERWCPAFGGESGREVPYPKRRGVSWPSQLSRDRRLRSHKSRRPRRHNSALAHSPASVILSALAPASSRCSRHARYRRTTFTPVSPPPHPRRHCVTHLLFFPR